MRPMTLDLGQGHLRPYFLWDEDVSVEELRQRLRVKLARAEVDHGLRGRNDAVAASLGEQR